MIPRVYLCSQVVLSNCLNKFDVELSFLNDLRFSFDFKFVSWFRFFIQEFVQTTVIHVEHLHFWICCIYMHILHYIRKLWFHVAYQLFIRNRIFKKKMNEREYERKTHLFFQKCFLFICSFNITNVMLLIMALQCVVCVGCNSRMLIQ